MEGKKAPISIRVQDQVQGQLDDYQKAEVLAGYYQLKIGLALTLQPPADLTHDINSSNSLPSPVEISQPFTTQELKVAQKTLKNNKAPGHDNIPYEFLNHLTPPLQASLLNIYNTSWSEGRYPTCWKHSILMPVPKPGKYPTTPSAYRPIALLSCVGKLMERLVTTRLTWYMEEKQLLQEEQCGFRPHRGTLDFWGQMEYHICDTYRQHQVMTALFVDLEGAFDTAPHQGILYKLT